VGDHQGSPSAVPSSFVFLFPLQHSTNTHPNPSRVCAVSAPAGVCVCVCRVCATTSVVHTVCVVRYDHTQLETPGPIRTPQLSSCRLGQYLGGGPPGKPQCRTVFFCFSFPTPALHKHASQPVARVCRVCARGRVCVCVPRVRNYKCRPHGVCRTVRSYSVGNTWCCLGQISPF
jgi:hypothetical protein